MKEEWLLERISAHKKLHVATGLAKAHAQSLVDSWTAPISVNRKGNDIEVCVEIRDETVLAARISIKDEDQ